MIEQRARVVFLVRVPDERTGDFLRAYQSIRHLVAEGTPGHLVDQVCRSATNPEQWLITSEWVNLAAFEAWERSAQHRDLVQPLRECFSEEELSLRFLVYAQTPALA
ncbi:antibiotic biosynthesis monooxygenase family protein [Micromonospora sp. RTGN7]|uniref:antibiotic biosynthesis monooxygenase family protein n=1 Tax=Micromonospora sp. RTGN7 TaxID=3016526 RepID=UPI0029FF3664|nr:antibiotic biosynthesis monooxygenase family protein [Micromonospora sp. RTGN7]